MELIWYSMTQKIRGGESVAWGRKNQKIGNIEPKARTSILKMSDGTG